METQFETEIAQLKEEVAELRKDVAAYARIGSTLQHQTQLFIEGNGSRRGLPGVSGKDGKSVVGPAGRDGKDATVKIFTEGGKIIALGSNGERAEIVAVPGPQGVPGESIKGDSVKGDRGDRGEPGISPSIDEIVKVVLVALKDRWTRFLS